MYIFLFLSATTMLKQVNIYLIISFCALFFMSVSLNYYLIFISRITLSLDKKKQYLDLYNNKNLLNTYSVKEIQTDDKRWVYVLDENFILFRGIIDSTMNKKDLNLDIFKDISDIKIINEKKLFIYIFTHNKYFKWNLVAFLIMPLSAIISQFG